MTPRPHRAARAFVLGSIAWIGLVLPASAQMAPAAGDSATAEAAESLEQIQERIERARERTQEWQAQASEFEKARTEAPARLAEIEAERARLEAPVEATEVDPDRLEVALLAAEQDLALAQQEALDLRRELDRRAERRRQLPERMADARRRLAELESLPPTAGEATPEAEARERLRAQRVAAARAELASLEQEIASYEARGELLDDRIALAELRTLRAEERVAALRSQQSERWKREAERQTEQALESIRDAQSLSPEAREAVRRLAFDNAELAQDRSGEGGLLESIDDVSQKLQRADQRVNEVEADLDRLAYKLETAGLIDSVGLLLRNTRQQAPDVGMYRRFIRMRQDEIARVQERQEEIRDELEALEDADRVVAFTMERLSVESEADRARLEEVLRDLVETRRKHLASLAEDYEVYFQKLVDFDARQQELIEKTERLLQFIDQQILWIPSGSALRPRILADALDALRWFATPRYWGRLLDALLSELRRAPLSNLGALAIAALGFLAWRRVPSRFAPLAARARPGTCTETRPTLEAAGWTLALAPWGPLVLMWFGWRLGFSPDANQFVRAFAQGLLSAGVIWLTLDLPRQVLRRDGLADAHFGWPTDATAALRRAIARIASVAVPLAFAIGVFEGRGDETARESFGRIAFIALMLALTGFTHRMLRDEGVLHAILDARPEIRVEGWMWRVLHVAGVAAPLALAAGAARGYYFTALELAVSYHATLVFLFLLLVLFELALRWSLMARRRLAFKNLEEEREAARAAAERGETSGEVPPISASDLDLATVDAQTGRLLSVSAVVVLLVGLWVLWADLVPALGVLDRVELWRTTETVSVEAKLPDGGVEMTQEERPRPVTLADLLRALLVAFMAGALVRNLPGVLEISLFRRLGTPTGERYAYATIAKYTVALVGGVLGARALGVGWGNVQWLVAAVGLGLGFGLQEIFANFVSGLIILFERPIRVGDTVTVGEISGTVSKIRIRATWITGFDRKELVVPNKEFVTTRLVNWSLTDPVLRIEVPVGIAYGSDTEAAMRELLAVADANEHVLRDPKPQVLFRGFGASSLDFELRVFSPDVERRLLIHHQLHLAIDAAFRKAGIEIAFPQRDVHVRSLPERSSE